VRGRLGLCGAAEAGPVVGFLSTGAATTDGVDAGVGEVVLLPPPPPPLLLLEEGMGVMLDWIMSMRSMISVPRRFLAGGCASRRAMHQFSHSYAHSSCCCDATRARARTHAQSRAERRTWVAAGLMLEAEAEARPSLAGRFVDR
jgi:hypothetical protein